MEESNRLKLVIPTIEYKEQVMDLRKEFLNNSEGFDGCAGLEDVETYEDWIDFENRLSEKYKKEYVPSTVYLGIRKEDNKLVGIIDFRHYLSDFLFKYGGNIGYSVKIEERRKGYAKEMLSLMLEECKKAGVGRVLLTCDKENIASAKTIEANGGILEKEIVDDVNLGKSGIIKRYWISLKKKYANGLKLFQRDIELDEKIKMAKDEYFNGDIYFKKFKKVSNPYIVPSGICILDSGYRWLEFYDYSSKIRLTAIYNEKNEIVEWYFDIARKIGKEDGIPYEDDLYLDVVLKPDGETILLDEDEYKDAFERKEITKEEYDEGYKLAYSLIEKIKGKSKEMEEYTDKYLIDFMGDDKNEC